MSFKRESIRMTATLCGEGQKAQCMVSATKVTLLGTRLTKNCEYVIEWVSRILPEGNYTLAFEGRTIDMRLSSDGWQATGHGSVNAPSAQPARILLRARPKSVRRAA
jgi:hypothetical protein